MTRFGHFHRKFPSKPKSAQPKLKINHKTHLIPTNNTSKYQFHTIPYIFFHTSIPYHSILVFYTQIVSIPWLFLNFFSSFFFLLLLLFFILPFSSPNLPYPKPKNEFLLKPCLALSKIWLTFLLLLFGPFFSFYLQFHLFKSYFNI